MNSYRTQCCREDTVRRGGCGQDQHGLLDVPMGRIRLAMVVFRSAETHPKCETEAIYKLYINIYTYVCSHIPRRSHVMYLCPRVNGISNVTESSCSDTCTYSNEHSWTRGARPIRYATMAEKSHIHFPFIVSHSANPRPTFADQNGTGIQPRVPRLSLTRLPAAHGVAVVRRGAPRFSRLHINLTGFCHGYTASVVRIGLSDGCCRTPLTGRQ